MSNAPLGPTALSRAVELHSAGRLEAAGEIYESVLRDAPTNVPVITQLGLLRLQQRRERDAAALFARAIELAPNAAEPHAWQGELLRQQKRFDEAIQAFHRALRARRDYAPAWFNLGLAYAESGRTREARLSWADFLRLRPGDARVRRELGLLAFDHREFGEALKWFGQCLELDPTNVNARCDVAATHLRMRQWAPAQLTLQPVSGAANTNARVALLLGQALFGLGQIADSVPYLQMAHALDPASVDAAYDLALAHERLGNLESAIRGFTAAIELAPSKSEYLASLATAELNLGLVDSAIEHYRRAVDMNPASSEIHSALLMALHYTAPDHDAIFDEHRRWAERHAGCIPASAASFPNVRDPMRRLRVGYVSPRFAHGPLGHFFLPVLRAHDRQQIEVVCYTLSEEHDHVTTEMQRLADKWRDCATCSDDELQRVIRADSIDILVDMAGHCPGHRLGVFARRSAHIQGSWLDYDDTTGIPAMDFYLSDFRLTPPGGGQRFTESVICPAPVRAPYWPTTNLPKAGELPAHARGFVTFGCMNRVSKLSAATIAAWSRILAQLPGSRLILQATAFSSQEPRSAIAKRFADHGIDSERLTFRPFSDEASMLRTYQQIDVTLDPFPYNGCNITCDSLSMGVPVITLEGSTLCGRHGFALLSACGLEDWVTRSESEYIDRAVSAARGLGELAELRRELPRRFLRSPICDGKNFSAAVEAEFRRLWTSWCDGASDQRVI